MSLSYGADRVFKYSVVSAVAASDASTT